MRLDNYSTPQDNYVRKYQTIDAKDRLVLRNIPKIDKIMEWEGVRVLLADTPRPVVLAAVRRVLDQLRAETKRGASAYGAFNETVVTARVYGELKKDRVSGLRRVVNGTGVVLHTNLGRAPLPEAVSDAITAAAFGYCTLEYDSATGLRGKRSSYVEALLCRLTGAEAAVVVNNNAAAVLLALSAIASGREVVVSRGELVEIGGSFRIPEIMQQSGALLREVGATNRTHPRDYWNAVSPDTALLLKVHTSNFAMVGFTGDVSVQELAAIGREHSIPVMVDAGSGTFVDLAAHGIPGESTVLEYLDAGADLVTFSGDKLLGGPQAGIIVGKRVLIEPMKSHPLLRALRLDKLTLAALEGVLSLYQDQRRALEQIPALRMLTLGAEELAARAGAVARKIRRALGSAITVRTVSGASRAGGGTFPLLELPTTLVAIAIAGMTSQCLEERLRSNEVPIVGRISRDQFLLDPRTMTDSDISVVIPALAAILAAP